MFTYFKKVGCSEGEYIPTMVRMILHSFVRLLVGTDPDCSIYSKVGDSCTSHDFLGTSYLDPLILGYLLALSTTTSP